MKFDQIRSMHTIRKVLLLLLSAALLLTLLWGTVACGSADVEGTTVASTTGEPQGLLPDPIYYPADYVERDSWNIELSVLKLEEDGITVEIRDNDNLGYVWGKSYRLERLDGDEWVPIIYHSMEKLTQYEYYSFPEEGYDYITSGTWVIRPDQPGHYRLTKYLSGREFTLEFDLPA